MKEHHKIVTCASYGGTGSSVVTDFLMEFENLKSLGDFEFSIAHDIDGISDLQHYIVDDFHRLKVDEAIFRFKRLVDNIACGYEPYFNNKFHEITMEYVSDITDVTWEGFWLQHLYRYNKTTRRIKYGLPRKLQEFKYKYFSKKGDYEYVPHYKRTTMYFSFAKERFFEATRNYMDKLIGTINSAQDFEYLVLDQLVPPTNTERYLKYFNDIKLIVVDRDPRDLYLLNKLFWGEGWIPTDDVKKFTKWFLFNREHLKYEKDDPERVLRVRFEDFIFNYEETTEKIIAFLGIDKSNHILKKKYFNPDISIKNCRLWEKFNDYSEDIRYIEQYLRGFCYEK